jgi:hypothetical protein
MPAWQRQRLTLVHGNHDITAVTHMRAYMAHV